jgi:hypothetical protein
MPKIVFEPFPKQHLAFQLLTDNKTSFVGFGGGAGPGKSYLGCAWQLIQCFSYPGVRYALARRELKTLKATTVKTLFKVLGDWGINDKYYRYDKQYGEIRFNNGSEIVLLDLANQPSDPEYLRLGGLELTGAFVDESNECPLKGIEILSSRLGRHLNDKYNILPTMFETFNPSKDHVYWRYHKPEKENRLPEDTAFIRALATDNPKATPEYIEQLKKGDKAKVERLLYGNFDYEISHDSLMDYDSILALFDNRDVPDGEKYMSVDVARFGKDATTIFVWSGWRVVHVDVIGKSDLVTTAQRIVQLATNHSVPSNNIIIDEDGVGGGLVDLMRSKFSNVKGFVANKSPIKRGNGDHNYNNLKSQCYFLLAKFINERRIWFMPQDKVIKDYLIQELEVVKKRNVEKEGKNAVLPKEDVKELILRSPDYSDALMMKMWFELNKNETTIDFL